MRKVVLQKEDFAMFHQDITPTDYEFYRTHSGAFKRMWKEQTRRFWTVFVKTFDHFVWNYGVMKDFPLKMDDSKMYIQEIIELIHGQFVDGNASSARGLINDCVIVARNRHCVGIIDKAPYARNPFYMKETRESFRKLFGPPLSKSTIMKVICGLPVYVKFAGATVGVLRRWLVATDLDDADEYTREMYFVELAMLQSDKPSSSSQDTSKHSKSTPKKTEKGQFSRELLDQCNIDELTIDLEDLAPPKPLSLAPSASPTNRTTASKDGAGDLEKKSSKSKEAVGKVDKTPDSLSEESKSKRKRRRRKKGVAEKTDDSETSLKSDAAIKNGGKQVSTSDKHLMGSEVTCEANEQASLPTAEAATTEGEEVTGQPCESQTASDDGQDGSSSSSNGLKTADKECASDLQNQDPLDASKKRLHECAFCRKEEVEPKTFKRCQRCRGKANPKYYCSRECQVGDWKAGHKTEHKDD